MKKYNVEAVMTFEEMGKEMGISTQRAAQLCNNALKKASDYLLKTYGTSVKLDDIFPTLDKENIYEQMQSL